MRNILFQMRVNKAGENIPCHVKSKSLIDMKCIQFFYCTTLKSFYWATYIPFLRRNKTSHKGKEPRISTTTGIYIHLNILM